IRRRAARSGLSPPSCLATIRRPAFAPISSVSRLASKRACWRAQAVSPPVRRHPATTRNQTTTRTRTPSRRPPKNPFPRATRPLLRIKIPRIAGGMSMKAVCWYGKKDVRIENVPEPKLLTKRDAIVKTSLTAICGSDLHLFHGLIPSMEPGDILGHEFIGEVVEVGTEVPHLKKGDRVVVPFCIACGNCFFCQNGMTALCEDRTS